MKPALTPARWRVAAGGADRRRKSRQAARFSLYWLGDPNGAARIAGRGSRSGCAARWSRIAGRGQCQKMTWCIKSHNLPRLLNRGARIAVRFKWDAGGGARAVTLLKDKQKKTRTLAGLIQ